ncbi:MAG TPA: LptF/LptG family permease [Gemmatales bacterium]|nr:LptF/LptG family permease [Gemmatales bacterium]HMP58879.1 LptF/LptG family permease [Gemmatales bacterium]
MKHVDRMLVFGFVRAWLICFVSLVSLYIIIDLFNKLDDFLDISRDGGLPVLLLQVGQHYGCQLTLIFDRLCGMMLLLAGMFTLTWLQRNNELTPLLAAGVSMRRLLRPVWAVTLIFVLVSVVNREWVMPSLAASLQTSPRDLRGDRALFVIGSYEPNGLLVEGKLAHRQDKLIEGFMVTAPEQIAGTLVVLQAREARYIPPGTGPETGGWLLTEAHPPILAPWPVPVLTMIDPGKFFLKTELVDFEMLTRSKAWHQFASLQDLKEEMNRPGARFLPLIAMQIHLRTTAPALMLIVVVMGLGMVLANRDRHFFINAGLCLALAALFYGVQLGAKYLGENEYVAPALAAWLPLLTFGPLALVLQDAVPT